MTSGSPDQLTGGHLYHRRMAERAAGRKASLSFVEAGGFRDPLRSPADVVVVDSIAAWSMSPLVVLRRPTVPLAAILHQPPGGVDGGVIRMTWQRPLDQALYRRCRLLIATSAALGSALIAEHRLPGDRIIVIEPGSDLPATGVARDLRGAHRISLLCVANWLPNKGLLELLDAVARLGPGDAVLHLVGRVDVDAAYRRRVLARLQVPDLAGRVVNHGPVPRDEIGRLYRGADVFVLPSYRETYGTVYAEALAAGLPVIGWTSGNLRHLIDDGREGVLVRRGDVAGLSVAMARLAADERWRSQLADAARRRGVLLPTW
ncbi:MAG: glycosyltransferase family 4 protein, partial [Actinomycetota bacterium]|nr:glycosyltransferase family 4 protein [Actinomycetota bacterium]